MVTNWHTLCMDRYSYVISEWFHGDSLQLVFLTPQWPISKVPNWSQNLQLELRGEGVWYLLEPRLANKSLVEGAGGETCETCVSPCETPTNTIFKISQALGDITFEEVFKVAKKRTLALWSCPSLACICEKIEVQGWCFNHVWFHEKKNIFFWLGIFIFIKITLLQA